MLYYAILILGANELGPVSTYELMFIAMTLLFSSLLNALIFGDIASLIQTIGKQSALWQEKLDQANEIMKQFKLEDDSQEQIREFLIKTQHTRDQQLVFDEFLTTISPSLKVRVQQSIFIQYLKLN